MKINTEEMFCRRKIQNLTWTKHQINISILQELIIKRRLSNEVLFETLKYTGQNMKKRADNTKTLIIQRMVERSCCQLKVQRRRKREEEEFS